MLDCSPNPPYLQETHMQRRIGILLFLLVTVTTIVVLQNFNSSASANSDSCAAQTYIVQEGDNLGKISWRFDLTLRQLLDANNLNNHRDYFVGQELQIPISNCQSAIVNNPPPVSACGERYMVKAGDNLGKISWRFGVSLQALISANNLANYTDYHINQQLIIPANNCGNSTEPAAFSITRRERFGVAGAATHAASARQAGLDFGSFMSWGLDDASTLLPNVQTDMRMIRLTTAGAKEGLAAVGAAVKAKSGATWIIGNEMDVIWQDNIEPARYATLYYDLYHYIKQIDPTAKVAIGAISTPTPLRRAYLDLVLEEYRTQYGVAMPIDVWTIHTYILREQRNSWGAEIPPGMDSIHDGTLYELDDHGNVQEMTRLIGEFRQWMVDNGYRNSPLVITEMGILMPADFGFPPEVVSQYMHDLLNYLLNTTNAQTGYPQDGNRLVQQWYWFSVSDETFAVSNLFDRASSKVTPVGWAYSYYLR